MSFMADKAAQVPPRRRAGGDRGRTASRPGADGQLQQAGDGGHADPARLPPRTVRRRHAASTSSIAQIREVAALAGHPERGAALIAQHRGGAPGGARRRQDRPHPTAVVYQRRGYVTGGDTLTGELLSIAGFTNEGGRLAGKTGGFVPLEKLVANHPDYIVVSSPDPRAVDQGTALLSHPALTRSIRRRGASCCPSGWRSAAGRRFPRPSPGSPGKRHASSEAIDFTRPYLAARHRPGARRAHRRSRLRSGAACPTRSRSSAPSSACSTACSTTRR